MYFVKYGKEYLHDPRVDDRMLLELSLDCEENSCGFCDFTIYPNHPMYNQIKERDADNLIEVYDDDILLFTGFIYELGKEFYLDGHVKCKGELDFLNESIVRPYSTLYRGYGNKAPASVNGYFEWIIEQHNNQVAANKQFKVGINQGASLDPNNYIFRENDEYPKTIDEIKNKLLDILGGYLVVRHENGVRYIDYLSEWTESNSQVLEFGVNLTNYTQTDDALDLATFIVPLGARMSETEYSYYNGYFQSSDTVVNQNKVYYTKTEDGGYSQCNELTAFESGVTYYEYDEYYDESNCLLTIENIPGGEYGEAGYKATGDMVYCESAVKNYGWIGISEKYSDITEKENLVKAAIVTLKEHVSPKRTIEIKAVDMHLVNPSIKPIRIGEYVRVLSKPHNLDSYFLCVSIDLDLNNPENSLYTLGTTFDTLTGQQNKKINELNATINNVYQSAESASYAIGQVNNNVLSAYESARKAVTESIAAKNAADQATAKTELIETITTETTAKAEEAINIATASAEASGEATAIVEQIQNEISDVKGSATSLRDAIDSQITTKVTTMTADYVSETELTETKTELETSISQSATTVKAEVEQTYAKKTELTEVQSSLETSISLNSDAISATAKEVETVQVDVTTAQAAADTAKELANAAQSSADAAGTSATEAKSAAQTAQDLANAAQSDIDSLETTVTTKFAEIEETADSITTTVSETQASISDLAYNSRNLYLGTRYFDGDKWCNLDQWETWDIGDSGFREYGRSGAWLGIFQEVDVKEGETYTFSFWAKGDSSANMMVYTVSDGADQITDNYNIELGSPTSEYVRYRVTVKITSDGILKIRVENTDSESWLQIYGLKLEHGDFSGEWTPAIEDPDYAFQSANTRISTLEQTAEGFTVRLENLKIGCRNMLVSTDTSYTHVGTGGENECSDLYNFSTYYNQLPSLNGEDITVSFKWETDATSGTFYLQLNNEPWYVLSDVIEVSEDNQNGFITLTLTCDEGIDTGSYYGIGIRSDNLTGNVTISQVMFEIGNKASSWQMSPEDVDWFINEAAKTATNYLNFSELGLIVGNILAETLGKNVLIDDDSINIRSGDTTLAKFTEDTIDFIKQVVFTADGILLNNGDAFTYLGQNQILWEGAYYMHGSQSITFSANLSRQLSGAVFVWSYYDGTNALDQDFTYFFVPKSHVVNSPGDGVRMSDPYCGMMKYLYISNGGASGHANNASSGTTNGIAWDNTNYVLRYVIGV